MAYVVIQQHKFGRMYLCGWSKRWGATVCANRFVAIKYPTEDDAKLARDHAATRCPNFTDGRPIDWQVLEVPPTLDSLPRDEECWVRAAQRHPGNLLHSSGLATNDARHDVTQGRVAMDAEPYDRAWRIEQRAEELFKRDYPSGSFARRLPHFRSSYPDPVGDHYQRLAAKELSNQ